MTSTFGRMRSHFEYEVVRLRGRPGRPLMMEAPSFSNIIREPIDTTDAVLARNFGSSRELREGEGGRAPNWLFSSASISREAVDAARACWIFGSKREALSPEGG
jgi:hypothetical protein